MRDALIVDGRDSWLLSYNLWHDAGATSALAVVEVLPDPRAARSFLLSSLKR